MNAIPPHLEQEPSRKREETEQIREATEVKLEKAGERADLALDHTAERTRNRFKDIKEVLKADGAWEKSKAIYRIWKNEKEPKPEEVQDWKDVVWEKKLPIALGLLGASGFGALKIFGKDQEKFGNKALRAMIGLGAVAGGVALFAHLAEKFIKSKMPFEKTKDYLDKAKKLPDQIREHIDAFVDAPVKEEMQSIGEKLGLSQTTLAWAQDKTPQELKDALNLAKNNSEKAELTAVYALENGEGDRLLNWVNKNKTEAPEELVSELSSALENKADGEFETLLAKLDPNKFERTRAKIIQLQEKIKSGEDLDDYEILDLIDALRDEELNLVTVGGVAYLVGKDFEIGLTGVSNWIRNIKNVAQWTVGQKAAREVYTDFKEGNGWWYLGFGAATGVIEDFINNKGQLGPSALKGAAKGVLLTPINYLTAHTKAANFAGMAGRKALYTGVEWMAADPAQRLAFTQERAKGDIKSILKLWEQSRQAESQKLANRAKSQLRQSVTGEFASNMLTKRLKSLVETLSVLGLEEAKLPDIRTLNEVSTQEAFLKRIEAGEFDSMLNTKGKIPALLKLKRIPEELIEQLRGNPRLKKALMEIAENPKLITMLETVMKNPGQTLSAAQAVFFVHGFDKAENKVDYLLKTGFSMGIGAGGASLSGRLTANVARSYVAAGSKTAVPAAAVIVSILGGTALTLGADQYFDAKMTPWLEKKWPNRMEWTEFYENQDNWFNRGKKAAMTLAMPATSLNFDVFKYIYSEAKDIATDTVDGNTDPLLYLNEGYTFSNLLKIATPTKVLGEHKVHSPEELKSEAEDALKNFEGKTELTEKETAEKAQLESFVDGSWVDQELLRLLMLEEMIAEADQELRSRVAEAGPEGLVLYDSFMPQVLAGERPENLKDPKVKKVWEALFEYQINVGSKVIDFSQLLGIINSTHERRALFEKVVAEHGIDIKHGLERNINESQEGGEPILT